MGRLCWLLVWLVLIGYGVVTLQGTGALDSWHDPDGFAPDLAYDKYTTKAAWEGADPYAPMSELNERYRFAGEAWPVPAPRTPATFIVHAPLLLIPDSALLQVMLPVVAAIVVACFWAASRVSGVDEPVLAIGAMLAMLVWWRVYIGMVVYASATMIVPALIALAWALLRHPKTAGSFLGVAAAVKLWPALIIVGLLTRRDTRRVGWWAIGAAAGLTGVGLLLPGASVAGTVRALRAAGEYFVAEGPTNLSLAVFGAAGIAAGLVVFLWGLRGSTGRLFGASTVAALVLSPISWEYYWLAAVPAAASVGRWLVIRVAEQSTLRPMSLTRPPTSERS